MSIDAFVVLNPQQGATLTAIFERLFPADESGPGATKIGAAAYLDRALAGPYSGEAATYRLGLDAIDRCARLRCSGAFHEVSIAGQDQLLGLLEQGGLDDFTLPDQQGFFELLRTHCLEGLFSDPVYGGNRDKLGWRTLGHPGIWLENSAVENLDSQPVTKGDQIQSLADLDFTSVNQDHRQSLQGYDPAASWHPPLPDVDVVLVGVGGVGGFIAPMLCKAGLRVVALEAGPFWQLQDFFPDELAAAYYCRAGMGQKFGQETPRWRRTAGDIEQDITFSLGRMMNGVGGSIIHYGGWLRRFHPHHLRWRSHILERWGESAIPDGCTVADWPMTWDELEPWFTAIEQQIGIAGDNLNPFVTRSQPLPLPPTRPFRMGDAFTAATSAMGLHPHTAPVGLNTVPYNGYPATTYSAWSNGFGAWDGDKWHPGLTSVQEALATGNLTLKTHCRVTRVVTDKDGRATGVEYLDPDGRTHVQKAVTVILSAYTYENIRLMFLSGDQKHSDGLGNTSGQLGRHYMTKMFTHVDGFFPDRVFNRHTGPAAQAVVLDDFLAESFDPVVAGGFIGGGTVGAENQFLPIQIARESLPERVPRWGKAFKSHLQQWQHLAVVRTQPDMLPYEFHAIDLDPVVKDRSPLKMPVMRLTFDLQENEQKQAAFFASKSTEILQMMGAAETWEGPRFTGAGSSHDLGGCRMSDDPTAGVVDRFLQVHDTSGLYVFGGAALPTCPGINPTLTIWAVCALAADALIGRLRQGERR